MIILYGIFIIVLIAANNSFYKHSNSMTEKKNTEDATVSSKKDEMEVDESLYSRQLYVMGHDAQRRMAQANVLLVGLNGLGVETAKNIILAGVKSVTLHDDALACMNDLASQFYISESDLGQPRAKISAPKLAELNPYVPISVLTGDIQLEMLRQFTVVVLIEIPLDQQILISDYCHQNGIAFIASDVRGVFSTIFCDFGESFVVSDVDGEPAASSMISTITVIDEDDGGVPKRALVSVVEDTRHGLNTGDIVLLNGVKSLTHLNDFEFKVVVKDNFSFEISLEDAGGWMTNENTLYPHSQYVQGGYITQIKQPKEVKFKSMRDTLRCPGDIVCDFVKSGDHVNSVHLGFQALHEFRTRHDGILPQPGNIDHANEVVQLAEALNEEQNLVSNVQDKSVLLQQLALGSTGIISPICALTGGILAQEVLKACSGKFMPIMQWFYFDATETLPANLLDLSVEEVSPRECRYDSQIAVYGRSIQDKLNSLNTFLVGAGAIGCEMVKNWAMMGISTSPGSITHVTDMDLIEKSNLSRQFLFRFSDINCLKSTSAVKAAKSMNPSFSATAYESKVGPDTEDLFNDDFYESLDFVCTALDNVEARLYIDQRCLFYQKPMLESGTLGTKGHTQVVVPHLTENYGATRDPPEKSIPVCTLKHFPNLIEHTLQWAREWFEEVFKQTADDCKFYLTSASKEEFQSNYLANQQNMKLSTLKRIKDALVDSFPEDFADCVAWARVKFEELFSNNVRQLLHNFPLDRKTSTGAPFWGGAKKPPSPISFDIEDPLHFAFIESLSSLRAKAYGIPVPTSYVEVIRGAAMATTVPIFEPKENVKIATNEEEAKGEEKDHEPMGMDDIDKTCDSILSHLPPIDNLNGTVIASIDFDKDIDAHMRVVSSVSNLRARNYSIPEADLHTSRGIAGKITPAIATTTALVTGMICLEIYKIIQDFPLEKLFNSFNNLALPLFTTMEPEPPRVTKTLVQGKPFIWTPWDRVDIEDPDMTLRGLIDFMDNEYGLELTMLSSGVSILFSDFMNKKKLAERMDMKVKDVVVAVTKKEFSEQQKYVILEMITSDKETDEEVELPYLRFRLF